MNEHFIRNIEITTFKCFDHFEASGFKQVNLIGGKNNIGKTAFLEALSLNAGSAIIQLMIFSMFMHWHNRKAFDAPLNTKNEESLINIIFNSYNDFKITTNKNKIHYSKNYSSIVTKVSFFVGEDTETMEMKSLINSFNCDSEFNRNFSIPFNKIQAISFSKSKLIFPSKINSKELGEYYQTIQEENRENEINNFIRQFDTSITNLKFFANGEIKLEKYNKYQLLNTFGDGLRAYLGIILAIFSGKNSYLFIDELENGIHYSQFDRLWKIILTASKEVNCQIFATTHSKECIESYGRITKKLANKDISFITLVKNRENNIEAINYSYKTLQNSLDQDHEVRGW